MGLENLSDQELITGIKNLVGRERETILAVLDHLNEIESRRLYRELGYGSLFDYCQRGLGYSEASSYRRVSAARAIKLNVELRSLFLEGMVNLCTISTAAVALKESRTEVSSIIGKSNSEVQALVAPPIEVKPKEVIKPVTIKALSLPLLQDVPKEERYEIRFSLSKEAFERLTSAKERMANSIKGELSMEAVIGKLVEQYLSPKERKVLNLVSNGRYIPRSGRRKLYERDQGQCCYCSPEGIRCSQTKYLQIDHIVPYAHGGKSELSNLRLLCSTHNQLLAERAFGKDFIDRKIKRVA